MAYAINKFNFYSYLRKSAVLADVVMPTLTNKIKGMIMNFGMPTLIENRNYLS